MMKRFYFSDLSFYVFFVCFSFFIFEMKALSAQNVLSAQSVWDLDPHQARNLINQKIMSIVAEQPDVQAVTNVTIKQNERLTPLRIYSPKERPHLPLILFIHGGAWVAGNLDTHDNIARYLCREVQAVVVSVGYLNAPEGKYPLPLEQCYDALLWIVEHAQELHADAGRLAVVGDSAGGNMAAALCLLVRDRQGPVIDLQVLINPAPDLSAKGIIQPQGDELDVIRWYATQYVADPNDANHPYVSPSLAKDLSHLPSALVLLAEKDELRQDGQKYANQLSAAGVPTNTYVQGGIGHLAGDGARASLLARESLDVAVAALRGAFHQKLNRHSREQTMATAHYLFKILSVENWQASADKKFIQLSAEDHDFIHFSLEDQLDRIVAKYWTHVPQFVILKIDGGKLPGKMVLEANPGGTNKYYHLYDGSIPLDAVIESRVVDQKEVIRKS